MNDLFKLLKFAESEIKRAEEIYKPLEEKLEAEDMLDTEDMTDLDYYQGYADAMIAISNKLNKEIASYIPF